MPPSSKPPLLAKLFAEHGSALVRFLARRSGNNADAEDLAQEAWVRLQRLERLDELENPRAFLFQTASNLSIDRIRRERLETAYLEAEVGAGADTRVDAISPERTQEAAEDLHRVLAGLTGLSDNVKHAFIMHRGRGMTYPEIAAVLGVSVSMVEKYISQALAHCQEAIAEE